jgi:hypothetical protein
VRGSRSAVLLFVLFLCAAPAKTQALQTFVHSNDVLFTIRTDSKEFNVGDQIVIRYPIKTSATARCMFLGPNGK